jgi:hypothetical protein
MKNCLSFVTVTWKQTLDKLLFCCLLPAWHSPLPSSILIWANVSQYEGAVTTDGRGQTIWDTFAHTFGMYFWIFSSYLYKSRWFFVRLSFVCRGMLSPWRLACLVVNVWNSLFFYNFIIFYRYMQVSFFFEENICKEVTGYENFRVSQTCTLALLSSFLSFLFRSRFPFFHCRLTLPSLVKFQNHKRRLLWLRINIYICHGYTRCQLHLHSYTSSHYLANKNTKSQFHFLWRIVCHSDHWPTALSLSACAISPCVYMWRMHSSFC